MLTPFYTVCVEIGMRHYHFIGDGELWDTTTANEAIWKKYELMNEN